jgi:glycosyltransferase involved in cell wall biosynthesis
MRVLQICHSYYPPFLDCARQYAALFSGTAYKVLTVYLTGEPNDEVVRGSASDEVIFLGYKSSEVSGLKLKAIAQIKKITSKEPFLFCIAHRAKPTYVALLATKLPVISVHHNYNDFSRYSRRILVNFYQKRILMLGVSDSVRDDLRRDLKGWPNERIQTLYNRIDVDANQAVQVARKEARDALNLPQDAWVIGNVGRLHHDKDQVTLIRGFAKALPQLSKNSLLVILGSGPLEQQLKSEVKDLQIESQVQFLGQVPDAKRYFKAFDVFALTSDSEPFGMVLLEAMAAELPIICSDCGGGAEVVRGVGELFKFGDAQALSTVLINLAKKNDASYAEKMLQRLNGEFSDEAVANGFWKISFIKKLL